MSENHDVAVPAVLMLKRSLRRTALRYYMWVLFELLLPVFFVLAMWPVCVYLLALSHAYERSLGGADLIPVAAVLLITVSIDGLYGEISRHHKSVALFVCCVTSLAMSMVLLVAYGFIKIEYLRYNFPSRDVAISSALTLAADLSIASMLLATAAASAIKVLSLYQEARNSA